MDNLTLVQKIFIWAIPILFAITLHEVAHGWVANRCGDSTAKMLGRLTLNPLKHIDLVGTILVPGLMLLLLPGGIVFGWAKPVPVSWSNLRHPKRDMALVAAAGPIANLLMAIFWGIFTKICILILGNNPIYFMGLAGMLINITLLIFNLIPFPPLDGSKVLMGFLPPKLAMAFARIEPFGFIIILGLAVLGVLPRVIQPALLAVFHLFLAMFGLS